MTLNPTNPHRPLLLKIQLNSLPSLFESPTSNMVGALLDGHHLKLGLLCEKIPKRLRSIKDRRTLRKNPSLMSIERVRTRGTTITKGKFGKGKDPKKRGTP